MLRKRKGLIFVFAAMGLTIIIIYAQTPVHLIKPFFTLSLSDPTAPIDKLLPMHYALIPKVVCTPGALDAKGRFYIMGEKKGRTQIVILNQKGEIERIVTPRLKDGRFLKGCRHISVSPSGNRIWTVEWDETFPSWSFVRRVTVHDRNGKAKTDWLIKGGADTYWMINAYSENSAYAMVGSSDFICLRFIIGEKQPQKFKAPFFFISFHKGKYWWTGRLDVWIKELELSRLTPPKWGRQAENQNASVVITWTPEEGIQLVKKLSVRLPVGSIQWIDEEGNFYYIDRLPSENDFLNFLSQILSKIKVLDRMVRALVICEANEQVREVLRIFSPKGEIVDMIVLPVVIRPAKGEKLEYGQLVKVDETGIYLEVERVSEPREYRIVKIVKKPRWQVWLERLMKMWTKKVGFSDAQNSNR